jgi:hypothetical protein
VCLNFDDDGRPGSDFFSPLLSNIKIKHAFHYCKEPFVFAHSHKVAVAICGHHSLSRADIASCYEMHDGSGPFRDSHRISHSSPILLLDVFFFFFFFFFSIAIRTRFFFRIKYGSDTIVFGGAGGGPSQGLWPTCDVTARRRSLYGMVNLTLYSP